MRALLRTFHTRRTELDDITTPTFQLDRERGTEGLHQKLSTRGGNGKCNWDSADYVLFLCALGMVYRLFHAFF